jgi:hypothetical protein
MKHLWQSLSPGVRTRNYVKGTLHGNTPTTTLTLAENTLQCTADKLPNDGEVHNNGKWGKNPE